MSAKFWEAGGGCLPSVWGYGFWTGPERDLLCVYDNIATNWCCEVYLSPISRYKLLSFVLFKIKSFRLRKQLLLDQEYYFIATSPVQLAAGKKTVGLAEILPKKSI